MKNQSGLFLRLSCLLLSLSLLLAAGCATRVDGLYISENFKPATLKSETMITGGVVDVSVDQSSGRAAPYNRLQSNSYSALMLSEFKDERAELRLKPVDTLIQALGGKSYDQLIEKYTHSGLDAADLARIAAKVPKGRFLALAKIESNLTEKDATHQDKYETKDDKGRVTKYPESWTKTHKRTLVVSLHIYDLASQDVAFTGQVTQSRENSRTYTVNDVGRVISVVKAIQGKDPDANYPTPDAPETRQVLMDVMAGFAENFPEE
jgi:hypothetical protein